MKEKLKKTTIYLWETQDQKLKELSMGRKGEITHLIRRGIDMAIKERGKQNE